MRYVDFLNDPVWENEVNVIYKFTNTLNNKIYIGQTSTSLRKRVINHLTKSRKWTKSRKGYFQHALFKYGIENFNHKELWNNQDFRDKHIENAKMLSKITSKKVLQLDYNYNIIGSYNSIREVQKLLYNNLRSNLARNLANNSTRGFYKNGYIWMKESDYLKRK